jgi:hypothetical protein
MNVLHRLSSIALVALMATACADQNMTNESSPNDLSKPTPLFSVVGPPTTVNFEPPDYATGSVNAQDDWSSTGPYDQAVVSNTYGYSTFGTQSLRISNAVTSGSFGDQTFSKRTTNYAGESGSDCGTPTWCLTGGTLQKHFEVEWDFASTVPGAEQPGLALTVSPDRGDGARMSFVRMTDTPTGLSVDFVDVHGKANPANFVESRIAKGLDRTTPHTIKLTMDLLDGPSNDVVKVYVDGVLKVTGTSWENYYRFDSEQTPAGNKLPIVNRIILRTGGTAAPATNGKGFLIDNLSLAASNVAGSKDACKNGGWQSLTRADGSSFNSQSDCTQYVGPGN